ncbi:MAG: type III-A CRISPR-associated RAMP protein Csm3 [Thermanaerothrix sp.]|uniref:type III-A CRISPR-associated RAMP protein Csm3 n=1 Tax=Thermanaerothrix sp. TaxID=2972675 RepID=UPI003C79B717
MINYSHLLGKFILSCKITCVTGLHIGGSSIGMEIGGVDNPVIKDPLTDQPYIPGSSLKGKLRSLAEWYYGLIEKHPKHKSYQAYDCSELADDPEKIPPEQRTKWQSAFIVGRLFGAANDDKKVREVTGPSRLTIRDAFLTEESKTLLQQVLGEGVFTEVKTENALDRITSEANPRPVERVPAGSEFNLTMILDIYDPQDLELFKALFTSMALLEQSSLGGGGSRGSGEIKFEELKISWRSAKDYQNGQAPTPVELPAESVDEILKNFDQIQWPSVKP